MVTKEPAQYIGDEAAREVPGRPEPVPSAAQGSVNLRILVLALATAAHMASPERKGRALSITIGGISVAWVVGVPLGAVIVDYFGWRTSFGVAAALAVVAAAGVGLLLPAVSNPSPAGGLASRLAVAAATASHHLRAPTPEPSGLSRTKQTPRISPDLCGPAR